MSELGEGVGFGGALELEWKCPHEHEKAKFEERNEDIDEDYEEDSYVMNNELAEQRAQHDLKNAASKLGKNLGGKPEPTVQVNGKSYNVTVAAHHLIPGNASLKPSSIVEYISKSKGKIAENIGYNVNSAANGVWLAGWYAISGWGALRMSDPDFCSHYVEACIRDTRSQFHDTHGEYSNEVLNKLEELVVQVRNTGQALCDECKKIKENDGLLPPPYGVVKELDKISGSLRKKVTAVKKWTAPLITSTTWRNLIIKVGKELGK